MTGKSSTETRLLSRKDRVHGHADRAESVSGEASRQWQIGCASNPQKF
jgi:hypothetical protein